MGFPAEPFTSAAWEWLWLFVLSPARWKPAEKRLELQPPPHWQLAPLSVPQEGASDIARVGWSCTGFHSLSCKEGRARGYSETRESCLLQTMRLAWLNVFFFLLQQLLLSFWEFINYVVAVQVLNITVIFWLLKESRKLLWNKMFIIGYLMEFISCLSIQHYASLAAGLSYDDM